jgi:putative RecB family exonuclease
MVEYKIDHLSASQINLYLQCSLKYRFQYVDHIPRPFKSSGLAFGSVIHSTIDWFHKERKKGRQVSLERFYKILETDWFCQRVDDAIRYKEGENEGGLLLTAKEMLSLYFQSPLNGVLEAELPFRIPLIHPSNGQNLGVQLEGFIDLIEEGDVLTEFKTSAKTMDPESINDFLQLTTYGYAYRILFGREPRMIKVINFVKTRVPKMAILETTRQERDYERFFFIAKEVLKGIRSQVFFPRQSFMCKDCEYGNLCGKWIGN